MLWYDMSYNQINDDFLNKTYSDNNNLYKNEVEDFLDEFNQTNTSILNSDRCIL